jgi:NTP pyrophosphatase (non-canonical NTP hydrolase)|nr:MAG TPA: nucleoside triphosphate pyrophosphohydrolase [Caudoviricetes sp.]
MINIEWIEETVKAVPSQEEKLRMIANAYGLERQIYKLMEECGELVAAAARYDSHDYRSGYHLAEEMADVQVMLEQIKYLLNIRGTVQEYMNEKIERQIRRMREAGMI